MQKWLIFDTFFGGLHSSDTTLTASLRRGLVPPGVVELEVLLLCETEPLLLHLVDLLLGAEGVSGHGQVVPQHGLLLPLPLGSRVLQLGALWAEPEQMRRTST